MTLTVLTGGARSGKSAAASATGARVVFVATAESGDEDMARAVELVQEAELLASQLRDRPGLAILVTNEVGSVAAARRRRLPVVLDGFIATAAVAPLAVARPGSLDHCIAGHCSAEPGHERLLKALGLDPLIQLDLRLGEGSGALIAVPIIRMAAAAVVDVATFEEWGLQQ